MYYVEKLNGLNSEIKKVLEFKKKVEGKQSSMFTDQGSSGNMPPAMFN